MLNKIWFWLLCVGIVYGFCKASYQTIVTPKQATKTQNLEPSQGPSEELSKLRYSIVDSVRSFLGLPVEERIKVRDAPLVAAGKRLNGAVLEATKSSIDICIPLIGIMALWLGLLNVAKDAGLIDVFARIVRPFMRWLFPEVPDGHPAQGSMLMNFAANMLGLDNAATPMGLKAMEDLQTLNPVKDTATNSMALFLAINCGSVTLIPFTIIGYRFASGSKDPSGIILGTLLASMASVVAGITAARWLARSPKYKVAPSEVSIGPTPPVDGGTTS